MALEDVIQFFGSIIECFEYRGIILLSMAWFLSHYCWLYYMVNKHLLGSLILLC